MSDSDKPPIMLPVNLPIVRRVEAWLWNRPKTTIFLMFVSFGLISSPAWFSDVWSLFSNEAPVPKIMNFVLSLPISISWYWIPMGLGAIMLTATSSLFWRERKRLEAERKRLEAELLQKSLPMPTPIREAKEIHAQCTKTIALLQEDLTVHSARAETNESAFKAFKEKYADAIELADKQAAKLGDFVEVVRVCTYEPKLDDSFPSLKWGVMLKNRSVFRISLNDDVGSLFFEDQRLTAEKELVENNIKGLEPDREEVISFRQRLSDVEAAFIKRSPNGKFQFGKLKLRVKRDPGGDYDESSGVLVLPEFRTKLGKCSDKETQSTEQLQAQLDELASKKSRLRFEIDDKRTKVQYRGFSDTGNTTVFGVPVRLRCSRIGDSKLAVRAFRAALHSEGDEAFFEDGTLVRAWVDNNAKENVDIEGRWIIDEPLTDFRYYDFVFNVGNQSLRVVGRSLFVRVTMIAIDQEPQYIDFFVDSWSDAARSHSSITLRLPEAQS